MGSLPAPWDGISCRRDARPASMGQAGLWQGGQGGHAEQVSQGVLTTVSGTSDAAAPFRLARHVAAGNVAPERSTARRLNSLPLIGAEPPLPGRRWRLHAGVQHRFSVTSWNASLSTLALRSLTRNLAPPLFAPLRFPRGRALSISYRSQARPSLSRSIRR